MANTREHRYSVSVSWNGNLGNGTSGHREYSRDYDIMTREVVPAYLSESFRRNPVRWAAAPAKKAAS
jgi:hypothetical protein